MSKIIDAHQIGSAPLDVPDSTPEAVGFSPLSFDANKFMSFVLDEDLSDSEAIELLRQCWAVFAAQVDLAFGLSPTDRVVDRSTRSQRQRVNNSTSVLVSGPIHKQSKTRTFARDPRETGSEES